jgi:hypothetical protein
MLLLDIGMVGDDVFMAIEAFFHGGHPWIGGTSHIRMTELALDLLNARVDAVAKGYGLFRANVCGWRDVEIVQKYQNKKQTAHG